MKYILTILLLMASVFNEIAEINMHKKQAKEAYVNGEYEKALSHYKYLVDSLGVNEPEVLLNLGNTYYKLKDTTSAISAYARVNNNGAAPIQSIAKQQNGILFNKSKKPEEALAYFKQALKDDPTNEDARYNYELLKKALDKQKEEEEENEDEENKDQDQENQDQQDQEQQNQDQENQENQDQQQESEDSDQKKEDKEGEESEEKDENSEDSEESEQSDKEKEQEEGKDGEQQDQEDKENKDDDLNNINEKLKDMKISEEKARMILEAMKNNEIQYFQQNKRKPTKKVDSSKPDW